MYRFYEKPEGAKSTIQLRTAMGENSKNQILSQEMVRRLMNTSEGLQKEEYWKIAGVHCAAEPAPARTVPSQPAWLAGRSLRG